VSGRERRCSIIAVPIGAATIVGMPAPTVSLIAIVARNGGIGQDNKLLVHLPGDLAHFKRTTLGAPIVMGRRTWQSIGRPLPGRCNIVVTRNAQFEAPGAEIAPDLPSALEHAGDAPKVWVIGGAALYAAALPLADELVLTEIDADFEADTFFPHWDRRAFRQTARADHRTPDGLAYSFVTYTRNQEP
jgi:dihydrofolate reductase